MEELFKALRNFKPTPSKKYFMKVEGEKIIELKTEIIPNGIEIDLKTFLQLKNHGIEKFQYKNNQCTLLPVSFKRLYPCLVTAKPGLSFCENDPYWVNNDITDKDQQYQWQIKSE